jgi:predicted phage terminase large subunit-like protein
MHGAWRSNSCAGFARESTLPKLSERRNCIIQTRWHELDLSGKIIEEMQNGGLHWDILCLAAQCESADDPLGREVGQFLWDDDDYGYAEVLRQAKIEQPPRVWNSLYQQRPSAETGTYFLDEWFRVRAKVPPQEELAIYMGADFATREGKGDFTAISVVGVDSEKRMWLLDVYRRQASSDQWVETLCDMIKKWHPIAVATEGGQISTSIGPWMLKRMRERSAYAAIEEFPTRGGDKSIRCQSFRAKAATNGVYIPAGADWWPAVKAELLAFPYGRTDDVADSLGLIGQLVVRIERRINNREVKRSPRLHALRKAHGENLVGQCR